MTYTSICRSYHYSYHRLMDTLYTIDSEGELTDEQYSDIASEIISKVDDMLPGSLMWMPHTSEIWADITDSTDMDDDTFQQILDDVLEEVLRPLLF